MIKATQYFPLVILSGLLLSGCSKTNDTQWSAYNQCIRQIMVSDTGYDKNNSDYGYSTIGVSERKIKHCKKIYNIP